MYENGSFQQKMTSVGRRRRLQLNLQCIMVFAVMCMVIPLRRIHPSSYEHEGGTVTTTTHLLRIPDHEQQKQSKQHQQENSTMRTDMHHSISPSLLTDDLIHTKPQQQPMVHDGGLAGNDLTKHAEKPYVVVTYLRGNKEKYIIGTIVLLESVQDGKTNYFTTNSGTIIRTAVVCHESVNNATRSRLQLLGHDVTVVKDVPFDEDAIPSNRFKLLIQKYVAFNLVQYEKALFVDSDAFVLRTENLQAVFDLLDDDKTFNEPVKISKMRGLNASYHNIKESNSNATGFVHKKSKVYMANDYGIDDFNSGVILYRPQPNMFEDFQHFLNETILPMGNVNHRSVLRRSTQRLLTEFLVFPTSKYDLYNFCPHLQPFHCSRTGCHCSIHIYPQTLDCQKDKDMNTLRNATIVHFAGSMIDYEGLCDPKSSPNDLNVTISNYFVESKSEHKEKSDWDQDCQLPMIRSIRNLYFDAIHRVATGEYPDWERGPRK